ncbi:MAG: peptidoglycan-binding protein [Geitlerinemataceae cyanobacterium]
MTAFVNLETQNNSTPSFEPISPKSSTSEKQKVQSLSIALPTVQMGQAGEAVRFLQQRLQAFEYHISFNGQFGLQIDAAVKHFQARYEDLLVDGVVGPKTWRALCENFYPYGHSFYAEFVPATYAYDVHMPILRQGTEGHAVECLQWILQALGYRILVDGIFGNNTRTTVEVYQKQAELTVDGIVGRQTWRELGINSNCQGC